MADEIKYPTPSVDWETRAFWEGCGRGELLLQRCPDCGAIQHRPRAVCAGCLSDGIETFRASGRGTVYTFTVTRQNQLPPFRGACPYVLAYVELEEGPRLLTNIVGCEPEEVRIGMPVRVEFVESEKQRAVPRFRPA